MTQPYLPSPSTGTQIYSTSVDPLRLTSNTQYVDIVDVYRTPRTLNAITDPTIAHHVMNWLQSVYPKALVTYDVQDKELTFHVSSDPVLESERPKETLDRNDRSVPEQLTGRVRDEWFERPPKRPEHPTMRALDDLEKILGEAHI